MYLIYRNVHVILCMCTYTIKIRISKLQEKSNYFITTFNKLHIQEPVSNYLYKKVIHYTIFKRLQF